MKTGVLAFGEFRLDAGNALLLRGDSPVVLPPKPFQVLCHLIGRGGELVTKNELLDAVWPNLHVSESSLSFSINAVRLALGDDTKAPRYIQTVPRRGYRFIAPVVPVSPPSVAPMVSLSTAGASPAGSRTRPWVGRDDTLDALAALAHRTEQGQRQVVFVTGEAGIGKTTLVDMALARLPRFAVLRGRCTELFGTNEAFLPLIEALQDSCRGGPPLRQALRTRAPTWLAQMPGLLDTAERSALQTEIFGANRERMLREFCDLLEFVSQDRPWIVVLEDLHWADFATLDVLSRFARRETPAAVLILATYRPAEVITGDHPVRGVHQDLQIHRLCAELPLDRLSRADIEAYLRLRFDDPALADVLAERIYSRTGGQPLFAVSMVDYFVTQNIVERADGRWRLAAAGATAQAGMPADLRDMIVRRIDRLTAEERQVLDAACVAGTAFSATLLAGATGGVAEQEAVLESLTRNSQILVAKDLSEWPDGTISGQYAFRHALYQEALYQRLPPAQRVRIHRLLGARLESGYAERTDQVVPLLALHFEGGRDFAKAVHYLELAADSSAKRFGNREAVNYLGRALDLTDRLPADERAMIRPRLLRQRGWVRRAAGDYAGSIEDLKAMVAEAEQASQIRLEVSGLLDLSRFCLHSDRALSLTAAEQAAAKSQMLNDSGFRALVLGSSGSIRMYLNGWRDADAALCKQAVESAVDADDPAVLIRRYGIESILRCMLADYRACLDAATQVKALARDTGDVYLFTIFTNMQSVALLHLGEWRRFRQTADAALAMAERNANRPAALLCRLMAAWLHAEAMDFHGARERCQAADAVAFDAVPMIFFIRRLVLAKACLGLGDLAAALDAFGQIEQRLAADETGSDYSIRLTFHHALGEYGLAAGDLPRAREQAMRLLAFAEPAPDRNHLALAHRLLARVALADGDLTQAADHAVRAVDTLADRALPHAAWRVWLTAAAINQQRGEAAEAAACRQRAEAVMRTLAGNFDREDPVRRALLAGFHGLGQGA